MREPESRALLLTLAQDRLAPQAPEAPVLVQCAITDRPSNTALKPFEVQIFADVVTVKRQRRIKRQQSPYAAKRSGISSFSRKSRKRMITRLAMLRDVSGGFFITLTYPDDVPHSGAKAKRDLAALRKRLARRFPSVGGLWRIEMKPRQSGQYIGQLAPHFHILMFGWQQRQQLVRLWVQVAWSRIVYESDSPPRRVRTRADVIHNRKHAARYASKYAAKEEEIEEEGENLRNSQTWGRRWGSFGAVDFAPAITVGMTESEVINLRRVAARWLKARGSRYARRLARGSPDVGFSVFGLGDLSQRLTSGDPTICRILFDNAA